LLPHLIVNGGGGGEGSRSDLSAGRCLDGRISIDCKHAESTKRRLCYTCGETAPVNKIQESTSSPGNHEACSAFFISRQLT